MKTYGGHRDWVRSVKVSPDGALLASCSNDQVIHSDHVTSGDHCHLDCQSVGTIDQSVRQSYMVTHTSSSVCHGLPTLLCLMSMKLLIVR